MTEQPSRYETPERSRTNVSSIRRFSSRLLERAPRQAELSRFYQRVVSPIAQPRALQTVTIEADEPFVDTPPSRWFGRTSFIACVVVPALLVVIYFAFIATNQYVAEMRLVVRAGNQEGSSQGLGSLLASAGGSSGGSQAGGASMDGGGTSVSGVASGTSLENAHILTSFIGSRGLVDDLLKTVDLREIYTRPEADFYARLKHDATRDELHEYWQKMVSAFVDGNSGIVTVEVRAFRPEDALTIMRGIEMLSEKLLNEISDRARQDTMRRATEELARARDQMLAAIGELERYRNSEGFIDPVQTAADTTKLVAKVTGDLLKAEAQLAVARSSMAPDAPAIKVITPQVDTLRKQVAELRTQIAGKGGDIHNIAAALARYEEVSIKQKMAETLYTLASKGLEKARSAAEAQSVYLAVFVPPALPDEYTYPKRWQFSLLISIAIAMIWGIAALVAASVDDHRLQ